MSTRFYRYKIPSRFLNTREGLLLEHNGGWGEIAPLPGFSRETLKEALEETLIHLPDLKKARPKLPSVQFGIRSALRPFPKHSIKIPLCALNEPREDCPTLKLKVKGLSLDQAIALVKKYVGTYKLRIDCNRGWTLEEGLFFANHFSPSDFDYLEEPMDSFENLLRFSEKTHFPIGVDESLQDSPFLSIPTLKAAIVKPTLLGSIPPLPPHISLVLSSSHESSVGVLQIAALAHANIAHGLDTFQEDFLNPPLRIEKGHLLWTPSENPIDRSKLCFIATAP